MSLTAQAKTIAWLHIISSEAAKEHELAADAYDAGDQTASELHSFKAYRHQLNAVQYSEIAVMEAFELNEINEI